MHPIEALALTLACGLVVVAGVAALRWAGGKLVDGIFWALRGEA
ncbi:hypothetical protein [Massilia sp. DD77]